MKPFSAAAWNRLLDQLAPWWPLGFVPGDVPSWPHPWHTRCTWDERGARWLARTQPGFCWNGRDPGVIAAGALDSRLLAPESGELLLTDAPVFPITATRLVRDPPPFFLARGARPRREPGESLSEEIALPAFDEQQPARLLRACDLVLTQMRPRNVVRWQIAPPETGTQAEFALATTGTLAQHARLSVVREFAPAARDPFLQITGALEDDGRDQMRVATLFFLGPPGLEDESAPPDRAWEAHTRHDAFWNAVYAFTPAVTLGVEPFRLTLAGLGTAFSQFAVNQMLAQNNDATAAALQALASRAGAGEFRIPGGPPPGAWDRALTLDPPFPFMGPQVERVL